MIVAGVDDAGRGSVLGPLVIAAVSVEETRIPELRRIGVKDSKLLSPAKRRRLDQKIREIANGISVWKINPRRIDDVVFNGRKLFRLNYLEGKYMALALSRLQFDVAFVDCCDTDQARFGELISELLIRHQRKKVKTKSTKIIEGNSIKVNSEHHADRNYPVVSAASIVAKVTRDASISKIQKTYGNFGSGYPSDLDTIDYIRGTLERSERLPEFTRLSWETIKRLEEEFEVRTLEDFA